MQQPPRQGAVLLRMWWGWDAVGRGAWALGAPLRTSLSARSFFACSKEMTSTSARARGSRQMSSAGTWMRHRGTGTGKDPQEGDTKEGQKAEALLKPSLPKTPAPARGGADASSPSLAAPSPPTPAAASGSCMGYSPGHQSWVRQPLEGEGACGTITGTCSSLTGAPRCLRVWPTRASIARSPLGAPALPAHQGPACW